MTIESKIRTIPHYPKQGLMFRDITTLLKDSVCFHGIIIEFVNRYTWAKIDRIKAIEAFGFIARMLSYLRKRLDMTTS
jgi:adenine phosphoribosyltransferase